MKEVIVVGANHGISTQDYYGSGINLEVEPPDDFLARIGLPHESNVGVEITKSALTEPVVISGETPPKGSSGAQLDAWYAAYDRAFALKGEYFFRRLAHNLVTNDSVVLPLDNERLASRQLRLANKLQNPDYILEHGSPKEVRQFARHSAKLEYVTNVLRDAALLKNVAERATSFDAIVIGTGHAALLCDNPHLQADLGIQVGDTYIVRPNEYGLRYKNWGEIVSSQLHPWSAIEITSTAQRIRIEAELTKRRHNAHTIGRVLDATSKAPHFLGRFYIGDLAANSLFELSITESNNGSFRGIVNDVLGDATVEGELGDGSISFTKTYGTMRGPGDFVPLLYTASQNTQGFYEGHWTPVSASGQGPKYLFKMQPFGPKAIKALG